MEFSSCYQNIYQPNTLGIDSQFADRVKVLLDDRRQCESDADSSRAPVIDIDMLHDCVQSLKLHKAAGHDCISTEYIIYGSSCLKVHVCLMLNAMLKHFFVPSDFRLKDIHGDITSTDLYRAITLTPSDVKIV